MLIPLNILSEINGFDALGARSGTEPGDRRRG
jgi:hypothetical protein